MAERNEPLSDRELDVLAQVVQGAANKEIAEVLVISPNTVKVHLRNIYAKLGVSSRTEASIAAVEQGLVTLGGELVPDPAAAPPLRGGEIAEEPHGRETVTAVETETEAAGEAFSTAAASPAEAAGPNDSPRRPAGRLWPLLALGALLIAALALAWPWLAGSVVDAPETGPAAEPFAEQQIDDTRWFVTRSLPEPREGLVLVTVGVNLYQIGGEAADGEPSGEVAIFDTTTRSWRSGAAKPTAVTDAGGANLFGEIYVVGGRLADGRPAFTAEAYSPAQDGWRPIAGLPRPLWGGLVLSDGGYLYHIGGSDGEEVVAESYVYDPSTDGWRGLPPLPEARVFATGGVIEGQLYVVGGSDGRSDRADCFVFDPLSEIWDSCEALSAGRSRAGAAVVLNKLYVIGGETAAGHGELYDPKTGEWQIINMPMVARDGMGSGWPGLGVTNVEARIYALGGRLDAAAPSAEAFVYAPLVYRTYTPALPSDSGGSATSP